MKNLGKIGLALGILTFVFGLYVLFIVAPASEMAQVEMDHIISTNELTDGQTYFDVPGYQDAMETMEKKVDYAGYVFFASMLPLILCLIGSFKKDKMAIIGLIISIGAFLIGAIYGTHMFS